MTVLARYVLASVEMDSQIRDALGVHGGTDLNAERIAQRLMELIRTRPLLSVALAGAVAGVLGGAVFSRMSRLLFLAAAGFAAHELLHRDGRFDVEDVIKDIVKRVSR